MSGRSATIVLPAFSGRAASLRAAHAAAPDDTPSPSDEDPPAVPEDAPTDGQAGGLPWYGWLLIGIAAVLVLYAMGYLIHNFTRHLRRRRRSQRS